MKNAAEDADEARIAAGEAAEAEEQRKLRACLEDEYASERAAWDCIRCGLPVVPFGGEDICMLSCQWCGAHERDCDGERWCGECGEYESSCSCP
jgi:hypothetical protein